MLCPKRNLYADPYIEFKNQTQPAEVSEITDAYFNKLGELSLALEDPVMLSQYYTYLEEIIARKAELTAEKKTL